MTSSDDSKRVAVVVVHGVGWHEPGTSAHQISDLLLNLDLDENRAAYTPFAESRLRIRTEPAEARRTQAESQRAPSVRSGAGGLVRVVEAEQARLDALASGASSVRARTDLKTAVEDVDEGLVFMRGQLVDYVGRGAEDQYATIRLEGRRLTEQGEPGRHVHVYEMYWSDLVRVGNGFVDIFAEFYQILLHLPYLGRHAVEYARLKYPGDAAWRAYSFLQTAAVRLLTLGVPILNLLVLQLVATWWALVRIPSATKPTIAFAVTACATLAITGVVTFRAAHGVRHKLLGAACVLALAATLIYSSRNEGNARFLLGASLAIGFVLVGLVGRAYARVCPYAFATSVAACATVAGFIAFEVASRRALHTSDYAIAGVELVCAVLAAVWVAFLVLQLSAMVVGWIVAKRSRRSDVPRIAATARLSLALPGLLLFILDAGFANALPFLPHPETHPLSRSIRGIVENQTAGPLLAIVAIALVALLFTAIALLPNVLAEVVQPKSDGTVSATRYGRWLNAAFRALVVPAELIGLSTALGLVVVLALKPGAFSWLLPQLGAVFGTSILGLFALRSRLQSVALGFRGPLVALLDVDTYLREYPRDATPRAKICARYVSLLRYLRAWRDPSTQQPYDAIVFVAHSQGTVITADLLRFLQRHPDSSFNPTGSEGAERYLFTMGSPLRQLYAERLPNLYAWCEPASPCGTLATQSGALCDALGLKRWVNAYRSGDYVGRSLWRALDDPAWESDEGAADWRVGALSPKGVESADARLREVCIGPGAHTHYWDDCGRQVAIELDALIENVGTASKSRLVSYVAELRDVEPPTGRRDVQ